MVLRSNFEVWMRILLHVIPLSIAGSIKRDSSASSPFIYYYLDRLDTEYRVSALSESTSFVFAGKFGKLLHRIDCNRICRQPALRPCLRKNVGTTSYLLAHSAPRCQQTKFTGTGNANKVRVDDKCVAIADGIVPGTHCIHTCSGGITSIARQKPEVYGEDDSPCVTAAATDTERWLV
jgi:hypothetical protein